LFFKKKDEPFLLLQQLDLTMTNVTLASAIENHPGFKKPTKSIGSIASIINDPSFGAITCL
jgi:hypothetical protein